MKKYLLGIVAVLLLTGCGSATGGAAVDVPAIPAPTVTVTATYSAPAEVPAACLRALDEADKIIAIFGETMQIVSDTFTAASNFDVAGINRGAAKIGAQTDKISASEYPTYANACRAEGQ